MKLAYSGHKEKLSRNKDVKWLAASESAALAISVGKAGARHEAEIFLRASREALGRSGLQLIIEASNTFLSLFTKLDIAVASWVLQRPLLGLGNADSLSQVGREFTQEQTRA